MISRTHRFHGLGSLNVVYKHGKTVRGPLLSVKYMPNSKRSSYRLAVVVSKKIEKSAVKRNRIRRRIFEIVRTQADSIDKPFDIIITVFSSKISDTDFGQISEQLLLQLKQAGIVRAANKQ